MVQVLINPFKKNPYNVESNPVRLWCFMLWEFIPNIRKVQFSFVADVLFSKYKQRNYYICELNWTVSVVITFSMYRSPYGLCTSLEMAHCMNKNTGGYDPLLFQQDKN